MPRRRIASVALVVAALVVAGAFLATRGPDRAGALAVYAAGRPAADGPVVLLVESFDLVAHRSVPVRVDEVVALGPEGREALDFEQEGERPAVVRVRIPRTAPQALFLRARNEIGPLEADVSLKGFPGPEARSDSDPRRTLGWPIVVSCADRRVVLLSDTGVPEVGNRGRVLVLVAPTEGEGANARPEAVSLRIGAEEAVEVLQPWGGTLLDVEPRVGRAMARIALRWSDRACEASFPMTAASRRTLIREVSVAPGLAGRHQMTAVVSTRETPALFALLAAWDPESGPHPLLNARVFEARDGSARATLDLPGAGAYQVRFTAEPLVSGPSARGADVIVVAGPGRPVEAALALLPPEVASTEARDIAYPFALATLAAAFPLTLAQVANTSSDVRAATERSRTRRDTWLLVALAASLVGLVVLMGTEVVATHRRDRRRLSEAGDESGTDLSVRKGLWVAAGVAAILVAAIAALILVLKTL